jgi:hypothetical protein
LAPRPEAHDKAPHRIARGAQLAIAFRRRRAAPVAGVERRAGGVDGRLVGGDDPPFPGLIAAEAQRELRIGPGLPQIDLERRFRVVPGSDQTRKVV